MNSPCVKNDVIEMIREDIVEVKTDQKEIKADIKLLLTFRYQVMGAAIATSTMVGIAGFIINLLMYRFKGE